MLFLYRCNALGRAAQAGLRRTIDRLVEEATEIEKRRAARTRKGQLAYRRPLRWADGAMSRVTREQRSSGEQL
jgi:hypothetical protein